MYKKKSSIIVTTRQDLQ